METAIIAELFHQINIRISTSLLKLTEKEAGIGPLIEEKVFLDESELFGKTFDKYINREYIFREYWFRFFEIGKVNSNLFYVIQVKVPTPFYAVHKREFGMEFLDKLAANYINELRKVYISICEDYCNTCKKHVVEEAYEEKQDFLFDINEIREEKEVIVRAIWKLFGAWELKTPNAKRAEYDLFQRAGEMRCSYMMPYLTKVFNETEAEMVIDPICPYSYLSETDAANLCAINNLYIIQYNWEAIKSKLLDLCRADEEVKKMRLKASREYWFLSVYGNILKCLYLHEYRHMCDYIKTGTFGMPEEDIEKWVCDVDKAVSKSDWERILDKKMFILLGDYGRIAVKR